MNNTRSAPSSPRASSTQLLPESPVGLAAGPSEGQPADGLDMQHHAVARTSQINLARALQAPQHIDWLDTAARQFCEGNALLPELPPAQPDAFGGTILDGLPVKDLWRLPRSWPLHCARLNAGKSVEELALCLNLSSGSVGQVEAGTLRLSSDMAQRASAFLGYNVLPTYARAPFTLTYANAPVEFRASREAAKLDVATMTQLCNLTMREVHAVESGERVPTLAFCSQFNLAVVTHRHRQLGEVGSLEMPPARRLRLAREANGFTPRALASLLYDTMFLSCFEDALCIGPEGPRQKKIAALTALMDKIESGSASPSGRFVDNMALALGLPLPL